MARTSLCVLLIGRLNALGEGDELYHFDYIGHELRNLVLQDGR